SACHCSRADTSHAGLTGGDRGIPHLRTRASRHPSRVPAGTDCVGDVPLRYGRRSTRVFQGVWHTDRIASEDSVGGLRSGPSRRGTLCVAGRRYEYLGDSRERGNSPLPRGRLCCDIDPHHARTLGRVGAKGLGAGRTYGADELPGAIAGRDHPVLWNRTRTRRSSISTPAYHACPRCLRCPSVDRRRMAAAPPLWSSRVPPALLHVLEPTRAHQVHNVRAALELIQETTQIQG